MPAQRFFHASPLNPKEEFFLEDKEHHHLVSVMRGQKGDVVEVINGKGVLAQSTVLSIDKKRTCLKVTAASFVPPSQKKLILAQAIPRLSRLDTILEKATELGVFKILLFPSTLSEKKEFSSNQIERLQQILINATKQCGRLYLPELEFSYPTSGFFGDLSEEAVSLKTIQKEIENKEEITFVIGPESGFTPKEIAYFRNLRMIGVRFHQNTLRTDTAAIASLSLLAYLLNLS